MRYKIVKFVFEPNSPKVEFGQITCDAGLTRLSSLTPFYPIIDIIGHNQIEFDNSITPIFNEFSLINQIPVTNLTLDKQYQILTPLSLGPDSKCQILALVAA